MRKKGGASIAEGGRVSPETVARQRRAISLDFFADFPVAVFALNASWQIVFVNGRGRSLFLGDGPIPYGRRPGDAFSCANAGKSPEGCGTTPFCRFCGIAKTLASTTDGNAGSEEVTFERFVEDRIEQLDLLVWVKPFPIGSERFLLFVAIDISADKRRESFERIFLHDLMNTSGSLSSLLHLLDPRDPSFDEYLELVRGAADQLTDEILSHRVLRDAEQGLLFATHEPFDLGELVRSITKTYGRIAESRGIGFDAEEIGDAELRSDPVLLRRVLANLLKNAIEACSRGDRVFLECSVGDGNVRFRIGNPAVMGEAIKANLFKRTFSTKGRGRGLGTYAARLFVEEYLGGSIECVSEAGKGTLFTVLVPIASSS